MTAININTAARTIELTKTFATKSSRYGSDEYNQLQNARRDYPGFKVVTVSRTASKSSFKGLTFEYMEQYIMKHDNNGAIMEEYLMLRGESVDGDEVLLGSATYKDIKDWFLDTYPAIAEFHTKREAMLEEIRKKKAAQREAQEAAKKNARRATLMSKKSA